MIEPWKISLDLSPDSLEIVKRAVSSGQYATASDVVRDALQMWVECRADHQARQDAIRQEIDVAAANPVRLTDADVSRHFDEMLDVTQLKAS